MEVFLCMEGFGDIYEATISEQKEDDITAESGTLEYWQQVVKAQERGSKPKNALAVARKIVADGQNAVPELLTDVIERARKLARSLG